MRRPVNIAAVLLSSALIMTAANYTGEIEAALKRAYKKSFPDYQFKSVPVSNFGVGTMYANDLRTKRKQVEAGMLYSTADTWWADSVSSTERATLLKSLIEEGSLGSVQIAETLTRNLGIEAALPGLAQVLTAGLKVDLKNGVQVTLKASEAINRQLNWLNFVKAARLGKFDPTMKQHLFSRDYFIASHDIELVNFTAEISVDASKNVELTAKLDQAVGKVIGKDASLKVSPVSGQKGKYTATATKPVVVAVIFSEAPSFSESGGLTVNTFKPVIVESRLVEEVEALVNKR